MTNMVEISWKKYTSLKVKIIWPQYIALHFFKVSFVNLGYFFKGNSCELSNFETYAENNSIFTIYLSHIVLLRKNLSAWISWDPADD